MCSWVFIEKVTCYMKLRTSSKGCFRGQGGNKGLRKYASRIPDLGLIIDATVPPNPFPGSMDGPQHHIHET